MSNDFLFPVAAGPSTRFGVHGAVSGVVLQAAADKAVISGALTQVDTLRLALMMTYELRQQFSLAKGKQDATPGAVIRATTYEELITEAMQLMYGLQKQLSMLADAQQAAAGGELQV